MRSRSLTPNRLDVWLASWRVAIRWGRREATRSRARSLLVMLLVGLPVAAIAFGLVLLRSLDIGTDLLLDRELGRAPAAVVADPHGALQVGGTTLNTWGTGSEQPLLAPGFTIDDPWTDERVEASVGSRVVPRGTALLRESAPQATRPMHILITEAGDPLVQGIVTLESGRLPQTAHEALVTPAGTAAGLPHEGSLRLGPVEEQLEVRIVGVATAAFEQYRQADLVLTPEAGLVPERQQWLVDAGSPVDYPTAVTWAQHGLVVNSRLLNEEPPPELMWLPSGPDPAIVALGVGLAAALVLETMLLAGPAFAVSASRQRHSLALASAQGAGPAQLRRSVLGYGLVLASTATLVAIILGLVAGIGFLSWQRGANPTTYLPVTVPWVWLAVLAGVAVGSGLLAAWWPARGVSRLQTMAVLRGQVVARRVNRGAPVIGIAMTAAGLALAAFGAPQEAGGTLIGIGFALVALGTLLLIPASLAMLARLTRGAPLVVRMVTRDNVRQRSRAVPTVAAVFGAMLAASAMATALVSSEAAAEARYAAHAPVGTAYGHVGGSGGLVDTVRQTVADVDPELTVRVAGRSELEDVHPSQTSESAQSGTAQTGSVQSASPPTGPVETGPVSVLLPPDCTTDQLVLSLWDHPPCDLSLGPLGNWPQVGVAPMEVLAAWPRLDEAAVETLAGGGVVVWHQHVPQVPAGTTTLTLATAQLRLDPETGVADVLSEWQLGSVPVHVLPSRTDVTSLVGGLLVSTETAAALSWPVVPTEVLVASTDGAIDPLTLGRLNQALALIDVHLRVETGRHDDGGMRVALLALLAALGVVALLGTVVGTALHLSEARADSATLASVGGTVRFRRLLAAGHAISLALVGGLLGLVTGTALGLAAGYNSNRPRGVTDAEEATIMAVHWSPLALVAVVCLVAATVGWFLVRETPLLTRRTV